MVIEPESLIFLSVPSCAAAPVANASAASRTRMRFIQSPRGLLVLAKRENSTLVDTRGRNSQPLGHRREQRGAEARVGLHQVQEHVAIDGEQRAIALGSGVGR